jgi:hypothetical protein
MKKIFGIITALITGGITLAVVGSAPAAQAAMN